MSVTWTISVGGRSYGPYSLEQMKAFQVEGRLALHSLVVRNGEEQFRYATEDAELAQLFPSPAQPALQQPDAVQESEPATQTFGRDAQAPRERNRYVILAEMKSSSISALDEEISNFGPSYQVMPQAWILTTEVSLNTLRSELIQKLGKLDMLMVVDTTNDKAAWFNFGPEVDTKVRRLWQRDNVAVRNSA